jgi:cobalt transporter subunit CbtA
MLVVLVSGSLAGLAWFTLQHFTVIPLIRAAESYEAAGQHAQPGEGHEHSGWQPANGWERTSFTALTTILTGIGFAAILFSWAALSRQTLNVRRGALWGLGAFVCFHVAPALGLPPQPSGGTAADLHAGQLWWAGTVAATAGGLWLLFGPGRAGVLRLGGVVCLLLPHLVGSPLAAANHAIPAQLSRQFAVASVATSGLFWLLLGMIGGFISGRGGGEGPAP